MAVAFVVAVFAFVGRANTEHKPRRTAPTTTTPAPVATTTAPASIPTTTAFSLLDHVSVPAVVELPRDAATAAVERVGLTPKVMTVSLANVPRGFVISQSPLPGALVPKGSTVSLVVSGAS